MIDNHDISEGGPSAHAVIDLVAERLGVSRDRVQLSTRLLQDLGMDGDDAVDFFEHVQTRFGTDLTHLQGHWRQHFGPEGFPLRIGMMVVAAAVVGGATAGVAGWSAPWAVAITVGILGAFLGAMRGGIRDTMIAITVADVVRAVEAGAWPGLDQVPQVRTPGGRRWL